MFDLVCLATPCNLILTHQTSDVYYLHMNEMLYYDLKDASGVAPGLAMQVSRELGRRIVAGHYKEDALIEDEGKLSQRFGVSKSVIREGVKLLSQQRLCWTSSAAVARGCAVAPAGRCWMMTSWRGIFLLNLNLPFCANSSTYAA